MFNRLKNPALFLILIFLAFFANAETPLITIQPINTLPIDNGTGTDNVYCPLVISYAISPNGICDDFPSPCSIPEGWEPAVYCPEPFPIDLNQYIKYQIDLPEPDLNMNFYVKPVQQNYDLNLNLTLIPDENQEYLITRIEAPEPIRPPPIRIIVENEYNPITTDVQIVEKVKPRPKPPTTPPKTFSPEELSMGKSIEGLTFVNEKIFIQTEKGMVEIKVLPQTAENTAKQEAKLDEIKEIKISFKEEKPVYEITGKRKGTLLFFFQMEIESKTTINAETGEVISKEEPFWGFLLS